MLGSFILRMAVVMAGFYLIMGGGHWERLAAAMLGFHYYKKDFDLSSGTAKRGGNCSLK